MSMTAAVSRSAEIQALLSQVGGAKPAGGADFQQQLAAAQAQPAAGAATVGAPGAATPFAAEIDAAAAKYGLDSSLLRGLIRAESNFNPNAGSPAGAQGLTQLMPATARSLGVTNSFDPAQAIDGGARYLRQLLDRFGGDQRLALAAYNAGPGAVQRFGGVPPYAETRNYVERVLGYAEQYRSAAPTAAAAALPGPSGYGRPEAEGDSQNAGLDAPRSYQSEV